MRAVTVSLFLVMFMVAALTAIAQDYGTHIPVKLGESVKQSLWHTDWSPDGKWIAFHFDEDIYIHNLENGETKNVTETVDENCMLPRFTPDSQEITFSRTIYIEENRYRHQDPKIIEGANVYTGKHRLVFEDAFAGSWSLDGNYFIYIPYPPDKYDTYAYAIYSYADDEISYYQSYNEEPPVTTLAPACMSPDNTLFITTLNDNITRSIGDVAFGKFYSIDCDDDEPVQIELGYGDFWYPEYSPDGTWLIYTQIIYDNNHSMVLARNVFVYNIETGEIIDLVPGSEFNTHTASWSPDGTQFCYILETDNGDELYIKDFEFVPEVTSVSYAEETPSNVILHGNYPNPFNPTTTIEFSLPEAGVANIMIYNLTGQEIRKLVSGTLSEGIHSVVWDGRNSKGLPVSAGVYVTQLKMGDAVTTGRMLMVK